MSRLFVSEEETESPPQASSSKLLHSANGQMYLLTKDTPAFQSVGLLTQLPRGSEIEIIGKGFSPGSVRVQLNGTSYAVFLRDLEPDMDDNGGTGY